MRGWGLGGGWGERGEGTLREVLLVSSAIVRTQDAYRESMIHIICMLDSISGHLIYQGAHEKGASAPGHVIRGGCAHCPIGYQIDPAG